MYFNPNDNNSKTVLLAMAWVVMFVMVWIFCCALILWTADPL